MQGKLEYNESKTCKILHTQVGKNGEGFPCKNGSGAFAVLSREKLNLNTGERARCSHLKFVGKRRRSPDVKYIAFRTIETVYYSS